MGLVAKARYFIDAHSVDDIREALVYARANKLKVFVLGGGSNIIVSGDIDGLVLSPALNGIQIEDRRQADGKVAVSVAAGENWHQLVLDTLEKGLSGLENLSSIPGNSGAAPIQNIGAYGQELENLFIGLDAVEIETGNLIHLDKADCQFGYRHSIFKSELLNRVVVTRISLGLNTDFQPLLNYPEIIRELDDRGIVNPGAKDVSVAVTAIRSRKLPDLTLVGNVGSFFKNPIISEDGLHLLRGQYPTIPTHQQEGKFSKVSAAWLIEKVGMKGYSVGGARVSPQHSLVIVNESAACASDVLALASEIKHRVRDQFGIELVMEPVLL